MNYNEVQGNLIKAATSGEIDIITHSTNCFCRQKRGLAPQMVQYFGTDQFPMEKQMPGSIYKLGNIDMKDVELADGKKITVINSYCQFHWTSPSPYGIPLNYDALALCLCKINSIFPNKHIGLPKIGCGLAGGDWDKVKQIIQTQLRNLNITVYYL